MNVSESNRRHTLISYYKCPRRLCDFRTNDECLRIDVKRSRRRRRHRECLCWWFDNKKSEKSRNGGKNGNNVWCDRNKSNCFVSHRSHLAGRLRSATDNICCMVFYLLGCLFCGSRCCCCCCWSPVCKMRVCWRGLSERAKLKMHKLGIEKPTSRRQSEGWTIEMRTVNARWAKFKPNDARTGERWALSTCAPNATESDIIRCTSVPFSANFFFFFWEGFFDSFHSFIRIYILLSLAGHSVTRLWSHFYYYCYVFRGYQWNWYRRIGGNSTFPTIQ